MKVNSGWTNEKDAPTCHGSDFGMDVVVAAAVDDIGVRISLFGGGHIGRVAQAVALENRATRCLNLNNHQIVR